MKEKYIHYSLYNDYAKYNPDKFDPIRNEYMFSKPIGGLWGSPLDALNDWKSFSETELERECIKENSFTFSIAENANIIHIRDLDDILQLPLIEFKAYEAIYYYRIFIDFEKCIEMGVDCIRFHLDENPSLRRMLYGWDCDCILVMNKDIIIIEE